MSTHNENEENAIRSEIEIVVSELNALRIEESDMEMAIAKKIVTDALAANYTVSVYDGEEWALKRSSNFDEIIDALGSTDWDQLKFRNADGEYVGVVALIWGNMGWELINDYTVSEAMESLLKGANDLADQLEEEYNK